jgi:hypothetical protein
MEENKMDDLMSKIRKTKKELEEMKAKGITEPGAGDQPNPDTPPDDQNLKPDDQGGKSVTDRIPEAEPVKDKVVDGDGFKQKYEVLQSKYDKEVPKLYGELRELRETVKGFQATIENQNTLIFDLSAGKPPKEEKKEIHKATQYSKLDLEDFGDYDEGIQKIIGTLNSVIEDADYLKQENTRLKSENESLKNEFTSVRDTATQTSESFKKSSSDSFWRAVNSAVPNFAKYNGDENGQNADSRWANFLKGYDSNMVQYRTKAMEAMQTLNAESFVSIVKEFEKLIGDNGGGKPGKDGLSGQVSPGRGAAAAGGGSSSSKIVTAKDIEIAETMLRSDKISTQDYKKLLRTFEEQQRQGAQ